GIHHSPEPAYQSTPPSTLVSQGVSNSLLDPQAVSGQGTLVDNPALGPTREVYSSRLQDKGPNKLTNYADFLHLPPACNP
ncbi:hypothetical protein NDU88_003362, partial [Pleurodeles waltl]